MTKATTRPIGVRLSAAASLLREHGWSVTPPIEGAADPNWPNASQRGFVLIPWSEGWVKEWVDLIPATSPASARSARRAMIRHGYTVSDARRASDGELRRCRNIGPRAIEELRKALANPT